MKELHEMTPKELHEEARGEVLVAIGRGDYSGALYSAIERAVRSGYQRGKQENVKAAPAGEADMLLKRLLAWAVSNVGTNSMFVNCYTYPVGEVPKVVADLLKHLGYDLPENIKVRPDQPY